MSPFVVDHRPEWSVQFESERRAIIDALGGLLVGPVEHIGSTAIPGLPAKPIIDMMAGVADVDAGRAATSRLAPLGYRARPHRVDAVLYVRAIAGADSHHLHLTAPTSALWQERLVFRDALRNDRRLTAEYRDLKEQLLARNDDAGYVASDKRDFVRRVLRMSGVVLRDGLHAEP